MLFAARTANPYVPVAPGRYVIEAREGPVAASLTTEVAEKGPTAANLVLNAGTLLVRAQAQKSGALLGDAIVAVDGKPVQGPQDVHRLVGKHKAGEPVKLTIERDGELEPLLGVEQLWIEV